MPSATAATARETPTPYEPMVTVTSLPLLSSTLQPERLGVLPAELEDVAHLDAPGQPQRSGAVRRRVALPDLGHVEHAVRGEVAAADQVEHVPAGSLAPVTQRVPSTTRGSTR